MISKITFNEIVPIWRLYLWPERHSKIEPNSAMNFLHGFSMENMSTHPSFFAYILEDIVVGVNSGHLCAHDNSYRSRGLYVFPTHRGKGIGKELLLASIDQGKKENAKYVWSYPKQTSWKTYETAGFILSSKWEQSELGLNAYCKHSLTE